MAQDWTLVPHARYGFLQVAPTPSAAEITRYYADEFYSGDYRRLNDSGLDVQLRDAEFYDAHRADMCRHIAAVTGRPLAGRSVLDVGCGWGRALLVFRRHGMACFGFDPAPEAVEYAGRHGLTVRCAGVDRMDVFEGRRFDVVTVLNVLEHLADPVAVVAELRDRVLAPGGLLVVDVPNEFNAFQRCGQEVHGLPEWWVAPPAHLNYFSGTTLRRLLEGEGYRVRLAHSDFPIEMFLLFGQRYVGDPALGRRCHEQRMAFEANLRRGGHEDVLDRLYRALAAEDLGRQVVMYAEAPR
ncbi:MAG: class I SAM-dependent methyltransferase [Candidatus Binatia bacterium]